MRIPENKTLKFKKIPKAKKFNLKFPLLEKTKKKNTKNSLM